MAGATQPSGKEEVMEKIIRVGVDLAKNIMKIHAVDGTEHVAVRKAGPREHFLNWFANLQPCLVAMEACCVSFPSKTAAMVSSGSGGSPDRVTTICAHSCSRAALLAVPYKLVFGSGRLCVI
jgi:hypothetical protein